MEVILTIILIYFIFRLIFKVVVRYLVRKGRKATGQDSFSHKASRKQKKKKVFRKEDGEYVDFEEINQKK